MQSMGTQLQINDSTIQAGMQIFKLAAMSNFIQGRRMDMVAAVCLYSACRKTTPCKVMLIDFADLVQANVFKLGHTFKKLHEAITIAKEGIQPVLPEDLIFRFAKRLEFGPLMTKVAEDAIRMVQRMSMDWMVMGRRPSGVCGACLILAARMNNFRRTITEVVYIVKVTTHTIQKRLEEFKQTPSSALTVEEFLHNEFLESAHDPPSFYEKTEEFQKTKKRRKRRGHDGANEDEDGSGSENGESISPSPNKRQKTANPEVASNSGTATDNQASPTPASTPQSAQPAVELRRDADGFVIPPQPTQSHNIPIDPELIESAIEEQSGTTLERLNESFNDTVVPAEEEEDDIDAEIAAVLASNPLKRKRVQKEILVPEPWQSVESQMEREIGEIVSDPHSLEHAEQYAQAQVNVAAYMSAAEEINPAKEISMDAYIDENEFADDPEVANCLLSAADVARKEKVWVNANKDWLRKQQLKLWAKKEAENGPPKARRNRKKKPRIGEGQTTPASSPGDAAVNALKLRSFSKKINYDAIHNLLGHTLGDKSALGSAATSRITSRAGSEIGDSDNESEMSSVAASVTGSVASSAMGDDLRVVRGPKPRARGVKSKGKPKEVPEKVATPEPNEDEGEDMDDDDYIKPVATEPAPSEADEEEDWRSSLKKSQTPAAQGDEADFEEDEEDYEDFGGIEPGGLGDDDTAFGDNTGYGDDDEQDEYGEDDYDE
ncbi:transcription factor TFIIIB subunit brf1, variant 2 [Cadophora gregata]|uniref:transcription factor TFIIIB subunit brf1, variant 2 n=2 Tax=Cadophora gregata TaxID=51156 RepID=UPI0026DC6307|nr:transcription factor TFIIIB subunit brf1, variant 2 [Cadophora gregata]KAK0104826.1 transcription factor TFIIIB subunit brf1, variant 2 [Cadophora gregata]